MANRNIQQRTGNGDGRSALRPPSSSENRRRIVDVSSDVPQSSSARARFHPDLFPGNGDVDDVEEGLGQNESIEGSLTKIMDDDDIMGLGGLAELMGAAIEPMRTR